MLVIDKNMKQNKAAKFVTFTAAFLLATSFQTPLSARHEDFDMIPVKGGIVAAPKITGRNISVELEGRNIVGPQRHTLHRIPGDQEPVGKQRAQGFLKELEEEKKNRKLMQRGKTIRKVGEFAGKAEQYVNKAAPVIAGVSTLVPVAAPYLGPLYAGTKYILKGAHKVLPIVGDEVELHYATKLSQKSYVVEHMSAEERNELIIQNARYQIEKLEVQLSALITENKKSSRKTKNQDLINEKVMKLSSYYDVLEQY